MIKGNFYDYPGLFKTMPGMYLDFYFSFIVRIRGRVRVELRIFRK